MQTHSIAMQSEETSLIASLAKGIGEWWGYLVAVVGALGIAFTYFKIARGKWTAFCSWCKNAAAAPNVIASIQADLQFEGGMSLRDRILTIDENMVGLRRLIAFETASRRAALQTLSVPMFEADKDGKFLWANSALLELADCDLSDLTGSNWRNIIAGPDRDNAFDGWADAISDGTDYKAKFRLALDHGDKWVRMHAICNKDDLGNILGFGGKIVEIPDPRIHETPMV